MLGPAANGPTIKYATTDAGRDLLPWLRARRPPPYRPGPAARRVDVALGKRLRQARRFVGATPQELAAAMGVSAATVRRYETGARRMSPKRFAAAVVFFGLPMSWFFSEDGAPGNTPRR
jgi:DNA-binding XRE family transcriptional regulator